MKSVKCLLSFGHFQWVNAMKNSNAFQYKHEERKFFKDLTFFSLNYFFIESLCVEKADFLS